MGLLRLAFWLLPLPALAAGSAPAERVSGYAAMGAELRAIQDDDMANPAALWLLEGEALWRTRAGAADKSCADCHGDLATLRGVAVRYPAFDTALGRPQDLEQRINACRRDGQRAPEFAWESRELLALTALVARQSRGLAIAAGDDARLRPFVADGEAAYRRRRGQIDLACHQCHDERWGRRLGGNPIPQGHPDGYPIYRLEWQGMGSLQRRLRACMSAVRAEPYPFGSPELVNLELFLMWRAHGMPLGAPGVRP